MSEKLAWPHRFQNELGIGSSTIDFHYAQISVIKRSIIKASKVIIG